MKETHALVSGDMMKNILICGTLFITVFAMVTPAFAYIRDDWWDDWYTCDYWSCDSYYVEEPQPVFEPYNPFGVGITEFEYVQPPAPVFVAPVVSLPEPTGIRITEFETPQPPAPAPVAPAPVPVVTQPPPQPTPIREAVDPCLFDACCGNYGSQCGSCGWNACVYVPPAPVAQAAPVAAPAPANLCAGKDYSYLNDWYTVGTKQVSKSACATEEVQVREYRSYSCDSSSGAPTYSVSISATDFPTGNIQNAYGSCDDGSIFTYDDRCSGGVCSGTPAGCLNNEGCPSDKTCSGFPFFRCESVKCPVYVNICNNDGTSTPYASIPSNHQCVDKTYPELTKCSSTCGANAQCEGKKPGDFVSTLVKCDNNCKLTFGGECVNNADCNVKYPGLGLECSAGFCARPLECQSNAEVRGGQCCTAQIGVQPGRPVNDGDTIGSYLCKGGTFIIQ